MPSPGSGAFARKPFARPLTKISRVVARSPQPAYHFPAKFVPTWSLNEYLHPGEVPLLSLVMLHRMLAELSSATEGQSTSEQGVLSQVGECTKDPSGQELFWVSDHGARLGRYYRELGFLPQPSKSW